MNWNIEINSGNGGSKMIDEGLTVGIHPAKIVEVKPGQAKKYMSEDMEDVLYFTFLIQGKKAKYKVRQVWTGEPKPSNLFKVVKNLNPGAIATIKNEADIIVTLENLKDRDCQVQLEEKTSGEGKTYLKVAGVFPITSQQPSYQQQLDNAPSFEEDEIPF